MAQLGHFTPEQWWAISVTLDLLAGFPQLARESLALW
jgi:hypothetical protein